MPIVIPGILILAVITTSIVTGVHLREDMDKGVFNFFKTLPHWLRSFVNINPLSHLIAALEI